MGLACAAGHRQDEGMRCAVHELATDPEGRCVLCRRAGAGAASPPPQRAPPIAFGGIAAVLLVCLVYRGAMVWASREAAVAAATERSAAGTGTKHTPEATARDASSARGLGEVSVVVYTTSWCSVCRRAKKWMSAQGIRYEERDVEASMDNLQQMHALNPRGGVPTFDVDGEVIAGFSEQGLTSALRQASDRRNARIPE